MVIARLPDTVQQAWGEPAARDFATWLEAVMAEGTIGPPEFGRMDARLSGVEASLFEVGTRLNGVETRLDGVETGLTTVEHNLADVKTDVREFRRDVNERLDRIDERFDRIYAQMNDRFGQIDARFDRIQGETNLQLERLYDRMTTHMRWSVSLVALFGTLITIIVAIGQLRP